MSPQDTLPFESAGGAAPPAIVAPVRKLVASELRRCVSSRVKAAGVGQAHQPALVHIFTSHTCLCDSSLGLLNLLINAPHQSSQPAALTGLEVPGDPIVSYALPSRDSTSPLTILADTFAGGEEARGRRGNTEPRTLSPFSSRPQRPRLDLLGQQLVQQVLSVS